MAGPVLVRPDFSAHSPHRISPCPDERVRAPDDPRVLATFERWKALIDKGCFNRAVHPNDLAWDSGANEMVFRGEAAMTLMGTWTIGHFENAEHNGGAWRDFDFFPFLVIDRKIPGRGAGRHRRAGHAPKRANPAGAKASLIHMAQIDSQKVFSRGSGALAPNAQVEDSFYSDISDASELRSPAARALPSTSTCSTPPPVANLGLDAFSEFLAFPGSYPQIVRSLADGAEAYFKSTNTPR